jgi:hypothetical protein
VFLLIRGVLFFVPLKPHRHTYCITIMDQTSLLTILLVLPESFQRIRALRPGCACNSGIAGLQEAPPGQTSKERYRSALALPHPG